MKKRSHTILVLIFCGCLLSFGNAFSGTPLESPVNTFYTPSSGVNSPFFIEHSPLNFLFSFEPVNHEVCRRPALLFNTPVFDTQAPSLKDLHYNSVFFNTTSIGANYFRVNENITLRNGNTFLLIPHSFTLPVNSGLETLPAPTMTLPRAN